MFSIRAKQRPIPSISASDSSKFQFLSISVRISPGLILQNTLYSFCIPNEPSTSTSITLASSFRTRCFFSTDKRSFSTNNVCIPFSRNSPNLRILRSTTPSDHFRIVSKQPLATSQNYQSLLPFKRKERLQYSLASSTLSAASSPLRAHPQPYNYPEYQSKQQSLLQSHYYYQSYIQEERLLQHLSKHYHLSVFPYESEDKFYTTHYMENSDLHSL